MNCDPSIHLAYASTGGHPASQALLRASAAGRHSAAADTSLESLESNAHHPCTPGSVFEEYRHKAWSDRRRLTYDTLYRLCFGASNLARFSKCGAGAWLYQHNECPHLLKIQSEKCRNRYCVACQKERGGIIRHNLERLGLSAGRKLSLFTFTLLHNDRDLRKEIDRLTTAFRELRRLKCWRENVKGAAWVLETKVGDDHRWHVHLHVLADAAFIPQGMLSAGWLSCTGDSYIVDVRRISAPHGAAYIAKYVSKPVDESVYADQNRLDQFFMAMRGKRSCAALGTWRACPLAECQEDEELLDAGIDTGPGHWHQIGSFDELWKRAMDGDAGCRQTLTLALTGDPEEDTT